MKKEMKRKEKNQMILALSKVNYINFVIKIFILNLLYSVYIYIYTRTHARTHTQRIINIIKNSIHVEFII